jgi:enoyl-CoA hydratase/carnithine racemase
VTFRSDLRRDVLFLTLDTPGGAVNVLTRDAASTLRDVVSTVNPSAVRAVVLRSGKPRSFVNGVGLMLAGTVKSVDEAARLTAPVREAYRALRTCPVPTVAAIRGNCYGCGVELTLQCTHRVASDERDTHFYMTELADYLMIPTFGATQDLPRLLGLESAVDFLVWGQRWSARRAFERGLVDGCFEPETFDREVDAFVDALGSSGKRVAPVPTGRAASATESAGIRARADERIRRLPPDYRELYATCFGLMEAATAGHRDEGYAREALEAARSALAPLSKAATPFFFMRQAAKSLALADCPEAARRAVSFETVEPDPNGLCLELAGPDGEKAAGSGAFRVVPYRDPSDVSSLAGAGSGPEGRVAVSDRFSGQPFDGRQGVVMHAPFRALGIEVVEVAFVSSVPSIAEPSISAALVDRYFTVVRTRPQGLFVIDELLLSFLMPQIAYLRAGGAPRDLAASVRGFGFTRLPGDWIRALEPAALRGLARSEVSDGVEPLETLLALPTSTCEDGASDPMVIRALLASLGGFAAKALRERSLRHVTMADVAAREVIDFPLRHTSLCRHLTLARSGELLRAEGTFRHLVPAQNLSSFEEFVAGGRAFYQGHANG